MKIKPVKIAEQDIEDGIKELELYLAAEIGMTPDVIAKILERVIKINNAVKEYIFAYVVDENSKQQ